ncbi:unnamed protein product [Urochloa decumbens]|uniref:Leucine-rich repeat-containing N-terminal plant-type domain-containing protein n=1 Tax=Urochloa decumbens TaxID=240449 RepID=A0ABC9BW92_9POAL
MRSRDNPSLLFLTIVSTTYLLLAGDALQHQLSNGSGCIPADRSALLSFRKGITSDPVDHLASWKGQDCCRWRGVKCSNKTAHVTKLHLRNQNPAIDPYNLDTCEDINALSGEVSPSLISLKHLNHIDLSMNCLIRPSSRAPLFFASIKNLRYLNLSGIPFTGRVPPQFGSLPKLKYLDLGFNEMYSTDITWLTNLSLLQYVSIKFVDLSMVANWPHVLNSVPSLRVIDLSFCNLDSANQSLLYINLIKLEKLDLSGNKFDHMIASSWFWHLSSLKVLTVGYNGFFGQFYDALENMRSLQVLDLSFNEGTLVMAGNSKKLCSLVVLDLTGSNTNGDIAVLMKWLQQCAGDTLQGLHLSYNNFTGTLPDSVGLFTSLRMLDLKTNNLSGWIPPALGNCTFLNTLRLSNNHLGSIPTSIGALTCLSSLDLSNNVLSGVIIEEHFNGLGSLKNLDLSSNNLTIVVNANWLPPFRLEFAGFGSCKMGPAFPTWLQQQLEITKLDISGADVKDNIPDYMSKMAFIQLNLSSNHLSGPLPPLPINITMLDISNNLLSGTLPANLAASQLHALILYSNQIVGSIPKSICRLPSLYDLDLSNNLLEGEIPQCFDICLLQFLLLSNNSLSGEFPAFLQKCINLQFLDLAWNDFSGPLPAFVGMLTRLQFLRLGHNTFSGNIPVEIVNLTYLQYLDLSGNNLSGIIPWHISNLTAMTMKASQPTYGLIGQRMSGDVIYISGQFGEIVSVITKGQQLRYGSTLAYFISIDLSDISLTGEVPSDITVLDALMNLNLSSNHLTGQIPKKIGAMHSLESLDLSKNMLFGEIPSGISNLASLSFLNLSYNNLSGRIPSGRQLDTLNADNPSLMYIGNIGLCGPPVQKNCSGNDTFIRGNHRSSMQKHDPLSFYLGLILGFLVGLWTVFCALLFMKSWRTTYFLLFDKLYGTLYVFVVVRLASLA